MTYLAEQLLELAAKAVASHAEVYQAQSKSRPISFETNRLKQMESCQSIGIALRVWRSGCPGLIVAYGPVNPQDLVERAIEISQLNSPEVIELGESHTSIYPNFGKVFPVEELVKMGKAAIAEIREAYPEVLCNGELECEEETITLINSQGLHCQYTDITIHCSLETEWIRGEDFLGIYEGQEVRDHLNIQEVVQPILQRLGWASQNASPLNGRIPVLFTAKAAPLLWETVAEAMNSRRIREGSSPWSEGEESRKTLRLGDLVMSNLLTLSQQPTLGPYSCPFDDEGTPTQSLELINQGTLQQMYTDRSLGRIFGTGSTGNGFRPSLGRYPIPDLINLMIKPGQGSLEDLIGQWKEGLVVDQVLGSGADISGNFSVNVDLGYRVHQGEIVGRVKDTMVSGNVYTALKEVVSLGEDCIWSGSCYTPSLIVEGLSVTSGSR